MLSFNFCSNSALYNLCFQEVLEIWSVIRCKAEVVNSDQVLKCVAFAFEERLPICPKFHYRFSISNSLHIAKCIAFALENS